MEAMMISDQTLAAIMSLIPPQLTKDNYPHYDLGDIITKLSVYDKEIHQLMGQKSYLQEYDSIKPESSDFYEFQYWDLFDSPDHLVQQILEIKDKITSSTR